MASVRLIGLTCEKTQEAKDELYFIFQRTPYQRERIIVGQMDDGETRSINRDLSFTGARVLQLWEDDRHRDDLMGNLIVRERDEGEGEIRHLFSGRGGRYRLTYEVLGDTGRDSILELVSLHCQDAQERRDEPYVTVNDVQIWGPVDMRTGDTQRINEQIPFHNRASIELWESDRARSDKLGGTSVGPDTARNLDQYARIHWGTNRRIDATYTLHFRVRDV